MTLHTFFSFVVMALDTASASASAQDHNHSSITTETETLVTYLIEHHSANDYTKSYLRTLVDTHIIKHIIESILQFGNEAPDNLTKLILNETIEHNIIPNDIQSQTITPDHAPQTPQPPAPSPSPSRIRNFFKRLFSCCFCCCRRRRTHTTDSIILETVADTADTTDAADI